MAEIYRRFGSESGKVGDVYVLYLGGDFRVLLADFAEDGLCGFDGEGADLVQGVEAVWCVCAGFLGD